MDPPKFSIHAAAGDSDLGPRRFFFFQSKQAISVDTFVLEIHSKSLRRNAHDFADIKKRKNSC